MAEGGVRTSSFYPAPCEASGQYHVRHVVQSSAFHFIHFALDGRHPLQLLLGVAVAGDPFLVFDGLLEEQRREIGLWGGIRPEGSF